MTAAPGQGVRGLLAREGVRFAAVGVLNTVFGYGAFVVLELTLGEWLPYLVVLVLAYVVGVSEAFVLHRRLVFRDRGRWLPAYLRFWSVYVVSLAINATLLPVLVEGGGLHVLVAQPLVLLLTALGSYVSHSTFTFRDRDASPPPTEPA